MIGPGALRLAGRTRSVENSSEVIGAKLPQHGHGGVAFAPDACKPLLRRAIMVEQHHPGLMVGSLQPPGAARVGQHQIAFGQPHAERQLVARPETVEQRRSEEHTSELQSLMRISYAVFCWKKKKQIR